MEKNGQNFLFLVIFEGKKGRYTSVILMFEKKELILGDDLRQKTRKFDGKNGQYPSINLIFDEKCG